VTRQIRRDDVFVIEPVIKRFRYLLKGGYVMDVSSPYNANSYDRELVLKEALRRWGGKPENYKIEGVADLREDGR
jgi:hypothetical protein